MADQFIDLDETQIYGPHAARKIRTVITGIDEALHPVARWLSGRIDDVTEEVRVAVEASRAAAADLRAGVSRKEPAVASGKSVLGRFSRHLQAHRPGAVDRKRFFLQGGVYAIRNHVPKMVATMRHIAAELKKKDTGVADAASWQREMTQAADALAPLVESVGTARTARARATPDVRRARQNWLRVYGGAKTTVMGLLRLAGRPELLPQVFHDLAVPSTAKVTRAPDEARAPA